MIPRVVTGITDSFCLFSKVKFPCQESFKKLDGMNHMSVLESTSVTSLWRVTFHIGNAMKMSDLNR